MKINESKLDSMIRISGAVVLLYLGSDNGFIDGALAIIVFILGVVLLLTSAVGFCPLYIVDGLIYGKSTRTRIESYSIS
jgi:hypothetical protein